MQSPTEAAMAMATALSHRRPPAPVAKATALPHRQSPVATAPLPPLVTLAKQTLALLPQLLPQPLPLPWVVPRLLPRPQPQLLEHRQRFLEESGSIADGT